MAFFFFRSSFFFPMSRLDPQQFQVGALSRTHLHNLNVHHFWPPHSQSSPFWPPHSDKGLDDLRLGHIDFHAKVFISVGFRLRITLCRSSSRIQTQGSDLTFLIVKFLFPHRCWASPGQVLTLLAETPSGSTTSLSSTFFMSIFGI